MTTEDLKNQFYEQTGNYWLSQYGEPHIDYVAWLEQKLVKQHAVTQNQVALPKHIACDIIKYCEAQQIYDKLGSYNDFYYELKKLI